MQQAIGALKPHLADEISSDLRLATAFQELDQLSTIDILFWLHRCQMRAIRSHINLLKIWISQVSPQTQIYNSNIAIRYKMFPVAWLNYG